MYYVLTVSIANRRKMTYANRLVPLFKFYFIIGLCSFQINPKRPSSFICTSSSLTYSLLYSFMVIGLTSFVATWTIYNNFFCSELNDSTTSNINDTIQMISMWIMYYGILLTSIKNRQKQVRFLNHFYRIKNDIQQLRCHTHPIVNESIPVNIICYLALPVIASTLSTIYYFIVDPRTNWLNEIYPLVSILKHVTNLSIDIYVKMFVVAQVNLQLTVNRIFVSAVTENPDVDSIQDIYVFIFELERLKMIFGQAFKEQLAISECRQFSMLVMWVYGLVLNARNVDQFWWPIVVVQSTKCFMLLSNMIMVLAVVKFGDQVNYIYIYIHIVVVFRLLT